MLAGKILLLQENYSPSNSSLEYQTNTICPEPIPRRCNYSLPSLRIKRSHFGSKQNQSQGICGLLWWLGQQRIRLQCRRPRFHSWVEKIPWRRKWQPTPVLLPGKFHGQRSLVSYSPRGHKRVRHNLVTKPPPPPRTETECQENPGGHNMGTFLPCVTNCAVLLIFPAITFSNSASPPFLGLIHPLDIVWIKQSLIKRRIRSLFWMRKNITIYSSHLKKILLYIF